MQQSVSIIGMSKKTPTESLKIMDQFVLILLDLLPLQEICLHWQYEVNLRRHTKTPQYTATIRGTHYKYNSNSNNLSDGTLVGRQTNAAWRSGRLFFSRGTLNLIVLHLRPEGGGEVNNGAFSAATTLTVKKRWEGFGKVGVSIDILSRFYANLVWMETQLHSQTF